jgi:CPA2 family monovalent cation:H+ antiporter-2
VGKPLEALQLREKYGINLALIERGKIKIYVPSKDQILFPGDRLTVTGTDQQLIDVKPILEAEIKDQEQNSHDNIVLDQIHVRPGDAFCKKSIRDSGIREKTHGLVVGIERDNERFLNPESGFEMIAGDIIWVVGDKKKIKSLSKENT